MVFVAFKVQNFCNFLTVVSLSFTSIWLSVPFYYFWLLAGVQCCGPGGSVHPGNGGAGLQGIQGHRTVNHSRWQPRPQTRVLQYFYMEIRCSVLNIVVDAGSGSEDPYNFADYGYKKISRIWTLLGVLTLRMKLVKFGSRFGYETKLKWKAVSGSATLIKIVIMQRCGVGAA